MPSPHRPLRPFLRRLAAALLLLAYQPHPVTDKRLYTFCYPETA